MKRKLLIFASALISLSALSQSQADKVVDLIYTKYLKGIISYQNITRVETYPYPKEAIREAVLNAISHKNYATLVPIQIRVYDNKIMIANDCVFPEDWTIDDLMGTHKSRPYNPLIANTFFRAGFIEAWGRGIQKIKDSCISAGNAIPEYNLKKEDIIVTFQGLPDATPQTTPQSPQTTPQLKETDIQIIKIIKIKPSISQRKIAEMTGVSYDTIRYHMENLKKQGIITRKGNGRSGEWIVL